MVAQPAPRHPRAIAPYPVGATTDAVLTHVANLHGMETRIGLVIQALAKQGFTEGGVRSAVKRCRELGLIILVSHGVIRAATSADKEKLPPPVEPVARHLIPADFVSATEAAKRLGMSSKAIRSAALRKSLPSLRDQTGVTWFDPKEVTRYKELRIARGLDRESASPKVSPERPSIQDFEACVADGLAPSGLTRSGAARALGVSVSEVRRLENSGKLHPTLDPSGVHRFAPEEIEARRAARAPVVETVNSRDVPAIPGHFKPAERLMLKHLARAIAAMDPAFIGAEGQDYLAALVSIGQGSKAAEEILQDVYDVRLKISKLEKKLAALAEGK